MSNRGMLFLAAVLLATVAPSLTAASTGDNGRIPLFEVSGGGQRLGQVHLVSVQTSFLQYGPTAESIVITAPPSYAVEPIDRKDTIVVFASKAPGGTVGIGFGKLHATTASDFDTNPSAKACAPGTHTSTFLAQIALNVNVNLGTVEIPIALDRSGTGDTLYVCLDGLRSLGVKPTGVQLLMRFRYPTRAGLFHFSALVNPFAAAGGPDRSRTYELRAMQPLPAELGTKATYSATSQTFTVSGKAMGGNQPWSHAKVYVHVAAGFKELGSTVTGEDGTYAFTTQLSVAPKTMSTQLSGSYSPRCRMPSRAPGGCLSESLDGISTSHVPVTLTG